MTYEAIIGIEVHAQLLTASKMYCHCAVDAAAAPANSLVCPACLGLPGALPVVNQRAVEQAISTALALNCQIARFTKWDRKNYSYPDLPKGYQISQYDLPISHDGWLEVDAGRKRIGIRRVHLEEDTAKLFHMEDHSLVDHNRAGVPLVEIVSEPDIRTPEEARAYLIKLRAILRTLGVSTADMEKGAMRCEPNVSLRPVGSEAFGTPVEIKNLNSFRAVKQALDYEIARQMAVLEAGGTVERVTMNWDDHAGRTVPRRVKEGADDYRYFPEPDLPPLEIDPAWVKEICGRLPELPDARRDRFVADYGVTPHEAWLLVSAPAVYGARAARGACGLCVADYFEEAVVRAQEKDVEPRTVGLWIIGELFRWTSGEQAARLDAVPVTPADLVDLLALVNDGTISHTVAKNVFAEMARTGRSASVIVQERDLAQISDVDALKSLVDQVLADHSQAVADYRGGKEPALRFLMGQVMKTSRGKANPNLVTKLLKAKLGA